jgi:hypothetical protein
MRNSSSRDNSSSSSSNEGETEQRPFSRGFNSKNVFFSLVLLVLSICAIGNTQQWAVSMPMHIGTITASTSTKKMVAPPPSFRTVGYSTEEAAVLDLIEEYKKRHSILALEMARNSTTEEEWTSRRFVLGTYSCPYQAGNRLNHFFSALAFALVTNRTLLWIYCENGLVCRQAGVVSDCERVIQRTHWIPSFYQDYLPFAPYTFTNPFMVFSSSHPSANDIASPQGGFLLDELPHQVVDFGVIEQQFVSVLAKNESKSALSDLAHSVSKRLFGAGTLFAYGAMFNASFHLPLPAAQEGDERMKRWMDTRESAGISVAIHSRHQKANDAGSNVLAEGNCLLKALNISRTRMQEAEGQTRNVPAGTRSSVPCAVALMTDRTETLERLSAVVEQMGCDVVVANHNQGQSWRSEHGPFAGAGFFADLAVAQYAVDAVVLTPDSSASGLLASLVAFQRATQAQAAVERKKHPLVVCSMQPGNFGTCSCRDEGGAIL